eukprot:scaffold31153_cov22-Tisochrysis_lutea.AAC.2
MVCVSVLGASDCVTLLLRELNVTFKMCNDHCLDCMSRPFKLFGSGLNEPGSWLCTAHGCAPPLGQCLQYGEFRAGYNKDKVDTRIVSYGLRYFIEQYVSKRWTLEDVERADACLGSEGRNIQVYAAEKTQGQNIQACAVGKMQGLNIQAWRHLAVGPKPYAAHEQLLDAKCMCSSLLLSVWGNMLYVSKRWTLEDGEQADTFYMRLWVIWSRLSAVCTHALPGTPVERSSSWTVCEQVPGRIWIALVLFPVVPVQHCITLDVTSIWPGGFLALLPCKFSNATHAIMLGDEQMCMAALVRRGAEIENCCFVHCYSGLFCASQYK